MLCAHAAATVNPQMDRPDEHPSRRAPTARRRPPRPESIRARRRRALVGRRSVLSRPSPGARAVSESRQDREAWLL